MPFSPSDRQQAIFQHALGSAGHLLVQACAGSGKTTTMVELAKLVPTSASVLALSFNKPIAEALAARMPGHVTSCTMHSLGFRAVRNAVRGVRLDENKLRNTVDTVLARKRRTDAERQILSADLAVLIPLVSDMMLDPAEPSHVMAACEATGRTVEMPGEALDVLPAVVGMMDGCRDIITFAEMIRHPLVHNYTCARFDVVMVDEAQDLNAAQHALLRKVIKSTGKLVAVGDRAQSIYGFRGADPESMDRLKREWNMKELPLDISYRCPRVVVTLAQGVVGDSIQPGPDAPDGEVVRRTEAEAATLHQDVAPGDMVLCRVNAPLVSAALRCIRHGVRATVRGRDLGVGLSALVRRCKAVDVPDLLTKVREWCADQTMKAVASRKSAAVLQSIEDKAETVHAIAKDCATVPEVVSRIESLFSDQTPGGAVLFSTVHKAKGLEADRVVLLAPELLPAPWAKTDTERTQEVNIQYVAYTRAKHTLVFQPIPQRRDKAE